MEPVSGTERAAQPFQVGAHGAWTDSKTVGYLAVGVSVGDELQDLLLAAGEGHRAISQTGRAASAMRAHAMIGGSITCRQALSMIIPQTMSDKKPTETTVMNVHMNASA
jgi:hypothetical protein